MSKCPDGVAIGLSPMNRLLQQQRYTLEGYALD
jgi:hypothetical protein